MAHKYVNRAWMTTATTGTGTVTLVAAVSGDHYTFAEAGMSNGDTANYVIRDGDDVEMGVGTYTSSGTTFSRDTVTSSRISGTAGTSKISLSGSATIFIGVLAAFYSRSREVLTANRDYYVRTDGNDSNDGLANTSGGAFLTIQKALDVTAGLDRATYTVTIHVASGTYTNALRWGGGVGSVTPILEGDTTTPSNVVLSVTSNTVLSVSAPLVFRGFKLTTTTSGHGVSVVGAGYLTASALNFGTVPSGQIHIVCVLGGKVTFVGAYTISGNAARHILLQTGGVLDMSSITVTLTGTPAWASQFIYADTGGSASFYSITWSGASTGPRYNIQSGGFVETYTSGVGSLPGNSPGVWNDKDLLIKQTADYTLTSSVATQKLFNASTNGTLGLGTGVYTFECELYLTTMSATSGNMAFHILGGGGATLGSILYLVDGIDSTTPLDAAARSGSASVTSASVASVSAAGTGTGLVVRIHGTFNVTAAGTIIPSCALVTANAAIVKAGSYFKCRRHVENGTTVVGEWS